MPSETTNQPTPWTGGSTRSVHAGSRRQKPSHAIVDPIFQAATYTFDNYEDILAFIKEKENGSPVERLEYGRYGNPTVAAAEARIAASENGEACLLFASGMAAVTTSALAFLSSGDHLVITDDCYRRTREFSTDFLKRFGVDCSVVPMGDYAALEAAIQPNTKLLISETPTNPYLRILDVEKFAQIARRHQVLTLIDSTFATPVNLQPLEYGIDLVIHSGTKYFGGHHDLLSGAVVGSQSLIDKIREQISVLGGISSPQSAYLLIRGLKTLDIRVNKQNQTAQDVAEFLEAQSKIERVWYPGLESHPDHQIAKSQMKGFGGVVSFQYKGDLEETARFIDRLQIPYITPSLGGAESLINQPALMSYYSLTTEERFEIGIYDNLVRLAVGLEDSVDLIADLQQALNA
jgi:cystathionine gamma-synthase